MKKIYEITIKQSDGERRIYLVADSMEYAAYAIKSIEEKYEGEVTSFRVDLGTEGCDVYTAWYDIPTKDE